MLEAGIMLILNANDAVSEAGQLTDELTESFLKKIIVATGQVLNSAGNDACSPAVGNKRKTKC